MFHMQNTYDAPSCGEHHEDTTSTSLNQSTHVARKIEESIDEEEKPKAKVADKNMENSSEDNSTEDVALWEDSQHIKPSPEQHAGQPAADAAITEENTERDSQNSNEDLHDYQTPAKHLSTAASMVSK